jgi:hypothetical protein
MKSSLRATVCVAFCLFLSTTLMIMGCGDQKESEVSGTVTYDGKPLEQGSIRFSPVSGTGPSGGGAIKDGKYSAKNLTPGMSKVSISGTKVTETKKMDYGSDGTQVVTTGEDIVPEKYNKASELKFELKPGSQTKDFDLPK